jgi:metal-responsive CopG/Arc/MetJ family transcriptional regulator
MTQIGFENEEISVDFPVWVIDKITEEAKRIGNSREELIRQLLIKFIDDKEKFEFEKRKFDATQTEQSKEQNTEGNR